MKCLNLIRRHGKTLLPLLAFFLLPIFSLGFSSESASAIEPVYTTTSTSGGHACGGQLECQNLSYLTASCDDNSIDFYVTMRFSGNSTRFYFYPSFSDYFSIPFSYSNISVTYSNATAVCTFNLYDENPILSIPSGSLSVTENGTYDVTGYAEAVVEVPDTETIIQGDYHDDLVDIKNIALVAIAVALFICFGRLILGMFMGVRR